MHQDVEADFLLQRDTFCNFLPVERFVLFLRDSSLLESRTVCAHISGRGKEPIVVVGSSGRFSTDF